MRWRPVRRTKKLVLEEGWSQLDLENPMVVEAHRAMAEEPDVWGKILVARPAAMAWFQSLDQFAQLNPEMMQGWQESFKVETTCHCMRDGALAMSFRKGQVVSVCPAEMWKWMD